jgi:hypothetical protein
MKNLPNFNYEHWPNWHATMDLENGQIDTGETYHISPTTKVTIQDLQKSINQTKKGGESILISVDSEPSLEATPYIDIDQIPQKFLSERISGGTILFGEIATYYSVSTTN